VLADVHPSYPGCSTHHRPREGQLRGSTRGSNSTGWGRPSVLRRVWALNCWRVQRRRLPPLHLCTSREDEAEAGGASGLVPQQARPISGGGGGGGGGEAIGPNPATALATTPDVHVVERKQYVLTTPAATPHALAKLGLKLSAGGCGGLAELMNRLSEERLWNLFTAEAAPRRGRDRYRR
jgi:hypothetical protein